MPVQTKTTLRLSRVINAGPEQVFDAWTRPELMMKWSCPEGLTLEDVSSNLIVGGSYRIQMSSPESAHTAYGTYREIDRPGRLVYTWDWEEEGSQMGETLITVEFNPLGDATEVIMTHDLFPTEEVREAHNQGWSSCLNRLETLFK